MCKTSTHSSHTVGFNLFTMTGFSQMLKYLPSEQMTICVCVCEILRKVQVGASWLVGWLVGWLYGSYCTLNFTPGDRVTRDLFFSYVTYVRVYK